MENVTRAKSRRGIATFRYQFPFMERGHGGRDSRAVTLATVRCAVEAAGPAAPDLPLPAGGHSYGGRMTAEAAAETPLPGALGLVLFGFPLHPASRPGAQRAERLCEVTVPMLFLLGTRDRLANLQLLEAALRPFGSNATLHLLDTADHGYRILKRTRASDEDVFDEMARVTRDWADSTLARRP